MVFEKQIVVDGKGHIAGRLASYVAKELLNGQRVVIVRTEGLNLSGSLFRNKVKFQEWMNKRMNHNPTRGVQHYRSPSRLFWRIVRGMLPHKTPRGAAALGKFKAFEGVPSPYDTIKKVCVPDALKVVRLKNHRHFCTLGQVAHEGGWKKQALVQTLEERRKVRADKYYQKKKQEADRRRQALNLPAVKQIASELEQFGY